ncbi:MinD superfamily P-loop ATPase [Ruminiclostridium sufflavum DSM 19573]|uniref:MinD superfamily P-loop ATPase n=1 Tax=Ruminiclostridium sufflavum DSM 19573 TaxID=1121337 RepID=A0A318XPT1_9FIRM|nr:ATP-binding protein [Ruminiclostridium sufflavum]PYG89065.1 MinD superfamily P-loop ATPase [Ruminiclostridium sufflavum DSM 19573]
MKQLVILSGKGGTGKTTVAASFIELSSSKVSADCDVDAPNLHLVHGADENPVTEDFYGYQKAVKYDELCLNCGKCEEVCQFGAIRDGKLNQYECEGCGVCEAFCPATGSDGKKAVRLEKNVSGKTIVYKNNNKVFSSAELEMGNGASGKLVTQVRRNLYASDCCKNNQGILIIDGSPGIGCPVIASVTGADMVLVVAEPTLSGIHDMERIVETAGRFGAVCAVCVNKYDVNVENTQRIEEYCKERSIMMAGKIPFDEKVPEAVNAGKPVVSMEDSIAGESISDIWEAVSEYLLQRH